MSGRIPCATCPVCGKIAYLSRADARRAAKQLDAVGRREGRIRPYRCGDSWHLGHLPKRVVDGEISRDQLGPTRRRTQPNRASTDFEIRSTRSR